MKYGVMLRKRKSNNQKIRFLMSLEKEFESLGYQTSILKKKHGMKESYSLYVGDVNKAPKIYATTYDTPLLNFIKTKYRPFNDKQKQLINFLGISIPSVIVLAISILIVRAISKSYWSIDPYSFKSVLGYIVGLILLVIFSFSTKGITRFNNFLTNTSSIVEMIKLAKTKPNAAFVFTDFGTQDNFGYLCLKDYLDNPNKIIIFIDSIGNDENKVFKVRSTDIKNNSLAKHFPNSEIISSGEFTNGIINLDAQNEFESEVSLLASKASK